MTSKEKILSIKQHFAEIYKCGADTWDANENVFIESQIMFFRVNTFGKNAVMFANKQIIEWLSKTFKFTPMEEILDTDNRYLINEKLRTFGKKLSGEEMWYLHLMPDTKAAKPTGYTYKLYDEDSMKELHAVAKNQDAYSVFTHALEEDGEYMLALAAYDNDLLVSVASCEVDEGVEWRAIGVDTLAGYGGRGLAAYLVKELALETEKRGKIPCYTTWSANLASTKVALSAGFRPVWMSHYAENL
ncbi:MAG: GNAT family N-acetyltransferase [Defluviitaleaceae bacterium]|nr:GNAT family N-acetyltransferase [Defluviitaleaceae bacterium]